MSQCINNSAESRITRAPARGAPRQTASAVRRCIIKRNYSSLPLINWVQLPRAGAMARHGEHSWPCQQSRCCSRGPSMCPPRSPCLPAPAAGGSSKLVLPCHGGTTRWASCCGETRVSAGFTVARKHLICCLKCERRMGGKPLVPC